MREAMNSSPEEARLLLNKWRSESVRLLVFVTNFPPPAQFNVRLEGVVTGIDPVTGTTAVESGEDFILFRLGEEINYQESVEMSANLEQAIAHQKQKYHFLHTGRGLTFYPAAKISLLVVKGYLPPALCRKRSLSARRSCNEAEARSVVRKWPRRKSSMAISARASLYFLCSVGTLVL
jgi:hypothetical protein